MNTCHDQLECPARDQQRRGPFGPGTGLRHGPSQPNHTSISQQKRAPGPARARRQTVRISVPAGLDRRRGEGTTQHGSNKMLIDAAHPEETRVVAVKGSRVEEFDYESASKKQLRGNIYLAKVTRVEPSLQAAFVDYGGNRHGFLAFTEIHPDYYQIPVADRQALLEAEAEEESRASAAEAAEDDDAAAGRRRRRGRRRPRSTRAGRKRPRARTRSSQSRSRGSRSRTRSNDAARGGTLVRRGHGGEFARPRGLRTGRGGRADVDEGRSAPEPTLDDEDDDDAEPAVGQPGRVEGGERRGSRRGDRRIGRLRGRARGVAGEDTPPSRPSPTRSRK